MNRVLVTGGAGFIGCHLARELDGRGWDVVSLDPLRPQVHLDPEVSRARLVGSLIERDILDEAAFADVPDVDVVIHLAAETGVGQSMVEADHYRLVNVHGTRRVADFAVSRQIPMLFFSSRAVYGEGRWACPVHGEHFGGDCCPDAVPSASRETDPLLPVSVYGETKVAAEELLDAVSERVPVTIVRPQNVIGAGQALHNPYTGVLAAFLACLREGLPIRIYGDGHQTRDFIHVSDVTRLVGELLERPTSLGEPLVVNCGSGERTTLLALAAFAIAAAPGSGSLECVDVHRGGDITHACADLQRCFELGLPAPITSTEDAVADFITSSWSQPGVEAATWDRVLESIDRSRAVP